MKPKRSNKPLLPRRIKVPKVKIEQISYKNPELLRYFLTEQGNLVPRSLTSVSQKMQRKLTKEIKRARFLALLPYTQTVA